MFPSGGTVLTALTDPLSAYVMHHHILFLISPILFFFFLNTSQQHVTGSMMTLP